MTLALGHPLPRLSQLGPDYLVDVAINGDTLAVIGLVLFAIVGFLYFFMFQALRGQTPGQSLVGIRVVDGYGETPSLGRALIRTAAFLPAWALFALGVVWIAFDREKRGLHDRLADTYVIAIDPRRRRRRAGALRDLRLASLLVQESLVSAKKMAEAFQRQVIYGGTLDTILLEMDVIDEPALVDAMGRASQLPTAGDLPSAESLQSAGASRWFPTRCANATARCPSRSRATCCACW